MNVSVFGLGYVGTVTAACLARTGHRVVGVDVNEEKVALINARRSPIVEPELEELLGEVVGDGRLCATTDTADALADAEAALICVGTPDTGHGRPDVEAIERVALGIGKAMRRRAGPLHVILRSTVLPGTTERVLWPALAEGAGPSSNWLRVIVNPEFMREGSSVHDFDHPPFVIAGSRDAGAVSVLSALYASVTAPIVQTDVRTAELVKYASNAFHGLKVCFANELATLSEALGADVNEVSRVFLMDRKLNVSEAYLKPGFAFGGSCLPKDLRALSWAARANDVDVPVLASVLRSNEHQIQSAISRVLGLGKKRIGVVGLAFKPNTDDLRESPMVRLVEALIGRGCDVRVLDRHVALAQLSGANRRYIEQEIPHIAALMCDDVRALASHADVLVLGSASEDAAAALAAAAPSCAIIDLTRGAVARRSSQAADMVAVSRTEEPPRDVVCVTS